MMGYNDSQQAMTQQEQMYQQEMMAGDPGYGYQYAGDMWQGRQPNDQSAQVRQALFTLEKMPKTEADWHKWLSLVEVLIDSIPRIPSSDSMTIDKINRKFKFLLNRANSQGCSGIMESKAMELLFMIRSQVSNGSIPTLGMTGVGAMITTHNTQKQEIRYPNQPQAAPGLLDIVQKFRGR